MAAIFWICAGFVGQALFGLRFVIQWLASEKAGHSVVPPSFWYVSVPAGAILVAYAIWRQDPVFILHESATLVIFVRNVFLLRRPEPLSS